MNPPPAGLIPSPRRAADNITDLAVLARQLNDAGRLATPGDGTWTLPRQAPAPMFPVDDEILRRWATGNPDPDWR